MEWQHWWFFRLEINAVVCRLGTTAVWSNSRGNHSSNIVKRILHSSRASSCHSSEKTPRCDRFFNQMSCVLNPKFDLEGSLIVEMVNVGWVHQQYWGWSNMCSFFSGGGVVPFARYLESSPWFPERELAVSLHRCPFSNARTFHTTTHWKTDQKDFAEALFTTKVFNRRFTSFISTLFLCINLNQPCLWYL